MQNPKGGWVSCNRDKIEQVSRPAYILGNFKYISIGEGTNDSE
jgi:hypothetical protein